MTAATRPWGVKGITDTPRPPVIAKAKIGEKGEKGEPRRLDYIIFVETSTGRRLPEYQAVFGDKPTSFNALLSGDRLEDMVDVAWKRYGKQGLKCRGDGVRGYDRETGEELQCAGEYNMADPSQHQCPHARPNGDKPPECKPVLSMRLVVPQIPGLGVVQLDTGGVASSIPTLVAQLRMIEDMTRDQYGGTHMSGIAVKVLIRAFPDRFGNAAYGWQLEPLGQDEAKSLRSRIEGLVRIEGQVNMRALPPIEETPDADIYGITEAPEGRQIPAQVEERPHGPEPGECIGEGIYPPGAEPLEMGAPGEPGQVEAVQPALLDDPEDLPAEVMDLELALYEALKLAKVPKAKLDSTTRLMDTNRAKAAQLDSYDSYTEWLRRQLERVPAKEEAQG